MGDVIEGVYAYSAWRAATRGEVCPKEDHLPTGLGGVEGHPQPGLYKKRDGGGYVDGKKQAHAWVPVKIYLTDDGGAVQHRWRKGLKVCAYVGENVEADPYKVWLWCQKTVAGVATLNAITQDEYNHWMTHGRWPDDAPETESQPEVADDQVVASTVTDIGTASAGLGHNSAGDPEGYDNLLRLLAQEQSAADAWIAQGKEGAAAATMAKNWADKIGELETRIDVAAKKEKKPHWDMCVLIDTKWRNPKALADALKRKMKATFDAIGRKETARLQAIADAEARARQVALEAKHRAEMEAMQRIAKESATPIDLPPPPPPPVVVAEQVRMTFGSGRKAAPKAPIKVAVITDWKAAAAHYATATKVRDAVQALANADAKKGIACPGSALQDEVAA